MANDALFLALAQARANPSRWYRALTAGTNAVGNTVGGVLQGQQIRQEMERNRTLNTRLGDIFPPDSIPGGLTPDHTVGQLMQLAPILPYTRSPVADEIANQMSGAPDASGSGQTSPQAPSSPPAPMGGTTNPAPPQGTTQLAAIQGTGAGAQDNIPAGTPPAVVAPSSVIGNAQPHASGGAPFRGMSYMDLQRYGPYLNDIRQGRQFQQGQAQTAQLSREREFNENARFGFGKRQEANQFQQTKAQELAAKQEAIEKEYQDKNDAITSGQDAIQSSLLLKQKQDQAGEAGPVSGRINTTLGNISGGGLSDATYQLNRNNELQRSKLQHAQDVNRFNPEEVGFIGGGALAQPNEPFGVSVQKAQQAIQTFQSQMQRNRAEKNAKLAALGLPQDNSTLPQINVGKWLSGQPNSGQAATNPNIQAVGGNSGQYNYASESQVPSNLPRGTIVTVNGRRAVIR